MFLERSPLDEKKTSIFTDQNTFSEKVNNSIQVSKSIDQLHLSKRIPNVSFGLLSCQEICK